MTTMVPTIPIVPTSSIMPILLVISSIYILNIVLNMFFVYYLQWLKKNQCVCAIGWKRTFIMSIITVTIILSVVHLILIAYFFEGYLNFIQEHILIVLSISTILTFLVFANSIISIDYINELRKKNCGCSKKTTRTVMYVFAIIVLIGTSIQILQYTGMAITAFTSVLK